METPSNPSSDRAPRIITCSELATWLAKTGLPDALDIDLLKLAIDGAAQGEGLDPEGD
jgi:hypothetical protein